MISGLSFKHGAFASVSVSIFAIGLTLTSAVPAAAEEAIAADEAETIVVTGTKRGESLQDTVQSVVVLGPEDTVGFLQTFDAFTRVPNVVLVREGTLPTVRGLDGNGTALGGGGAVTGSNARMTNYIDGVARSYSAVPDGFGGMWDLRQIEILRGAQSTTFGQNAIAGAIVQVTNDPVFDNQAALQFGVRSAGTTFNGAFMVNGALGDKLALRITGQEVRGDGFVDFSTTLASGLTAKDRQELSNEYFSIYRAKLLFAPTETTSLIFAASRETSNRAYPNDRVAIDTPGQATIDSPTFVNNVNNVLSLTLGQELGVDWTINGVLSWQNSVSEFKPPSVGNPDPAEYLDFTFTVNQWAFEPRLLYQPSGTRTSVLAGLYVTGRDRTDFGAPGTAFELSADDTSDSFSLFADATIQLARRFDLLLGGRYIEDNQTRNFSGFGGFFAFDFEREEKLFLPKVGLTYHLSDDASLSVLGYEGYNAGGGGVSFVTLTPYTFDKELSETVELVARTSWLDGALTVNANAFYTSLQGQQVFAIGPGGPNDSIIINIDSSRSMGLEFEANYAFAGNNQIGLSLGVLSTEIIDFGSAANDIYNGNDFGNAPAFTGNLTGRFQVIDNLLVGGNVQFSTSQYSDYQNTPEDLVGGYALVNIYASYTWKALNIQPFINNLFDSYVVIGRFTEFNEQFVRRPRSIGVNITARF